ncbi:sigma-54-dependent Fis family transcriptional regulator [Aminobacter sp. SR38]|jgi:transcriptional regulator of acetoin/glycerol metabolism|uniref:GAF domain-containing protein n=1 Tax=Aminobacter sp. SR38 TaxID=2774562 RepID=UPI00178175D4|nr:GAF domain-containing protein [Aminobacter sp. SR38]QOF73360.1 sigma-54-dependent Fis family transcriptional regulator [Aminobacter sp. SR38]
MRSSLVDRHARKVDKAVESDDAARSALVASWRRSRKLHHLDPDNRRGPRRLTDAELKVARQRIEPLVCAAKPSLDRLYLALGNIGYCVLLADRDGIPVERRGAPSDDDLFEAWGLWLGAVWNEESEGTNGIGTCLVEGRTLTIHRDQHFFARNTLLSCTTAPIYDHQGNLAAVLDVSSCRADFTEDFVAPISMLVSDAARFIEAENFRHCFPKARILLVPSEKGAYGMLAVNEDDLVVGANRVARSEFGLMSRSLAEPVPVRDLLGGCDSAKELNDAERGALQRVLARCHGNITMASTSLGISRTTLYRKLNRYDLIRSN